MIPRALKFLLLSFVAVPLMAQNALPKAPVLAFEKYTLANGLEVILVEDKSLPVVAVNTWYHVGAANEKAGSTGFAHLFEHMMYQGSKNLPGDAYLRTLEGIGASDLNATTSFDRTNFFQTVPSNQLELVLWAESDRMLSLLEVLDQEKLTNQIDVVRNERRQSTENRPYGLADEAMYKALFPQPHPYNSVIIGSHRDLEAVRLADVRAFFSTYYVPNNASMIIVGDFDKARTKALVEKYFGPVPRGKPVAKVHITPPVVTGSRHLTVTDKVDLPRVSMGWITPAAYGPNEAEMDLIADVLGGGKSSRLYQRLVYRDQIAQTVFAAQSSLSQGSVFEIEVVARPGVKPEQIEKVVDEELAALRDKGPTQAELDGSRNGLVASLIGGMETVGDRADILNRYNQLVGTPDFLQKDLDRYAAVKPQDVRAAATQYLKPDARVVIYAVPGEKVIDDVPRGKPPADTVKVATTPPDWRANPPAAGPVSTFHLPVPQRLQLANGLTVLLFEQHKLPLVSTSLVVLAGSDRNPTDKPGMASFTADLLDEGTATRSSLQIAEQLDALGAGLGTGSNMDSSSVSLRTLTPNADAAFGLMADVVRNPAFAPEEIERVRASRETALVQQRSAPVTIAQKVFNDAIYGKGHPYGYIDIGTTASVKAIQRADLQDFWRRGYTPANSALVIAGDVDAAEAKRLAEKHFGSWQGSSASAAVPSVNQLTAGKTLVVDRGAVPQTALRIGMVATPRSSPDYVPLVVMNDVLGGLFSSRINLNLREAHGYTYGANSAIGFRRGAGPFVVVTDVRTDVTAPAVQEIYTELQKMRDTPVTAEELGLARTSFSRSLPGQFETNASAAASGGNIFVYGLPLDYYDNLPAKIDAVSVADVQRVARQYLQPEKMITVAVGDASKIEAPLSALKGAQVEKRSLE